MRILVTGANGFIGSSLCTALANAGHSVIGALRKAALGATDFEPLVIGDICDFPSWANALKGVSAVVHLAARVHVLNEHAADPWKEFCKVNVRGTESLAQGAVQAGVERFVYVSSIGVMGNRTTSAAFTETMEPHPHDMYAISKLQAEQKLRDIGRETRLEVVIVRPPLVYGPGNPGNFLRLIKIVDSGAPLPLASVRNQRSLIYLGNLVEALVQCTVHKSASGEIFLVSDGASISTPDLVTAIANALGRPPRLFPAPVFILKAAASVTSKREEVDRILSSLVINNSRIRTQLGWTPTYSLEEGLKLTANWYRKTFQQNNRLQVRG